MATNPVICGFLHDVSQRGFCKFSLYLGRFYNLVAGFVIILIGNLEIKNKFRGQLDADFVFMHHHSEKVNNSQISGSYSF